MRTHAHTRSRRTRLALTFAFPALLAWSGQAGAQTGVNSFCTAVFSVGPSTSNSGIVQVYSPEAQSLLTVSDDIVANPNAAAINGKNGWLYYVNQDSLRLYAYKPDSDDVVNLGVNLVNEGGSIIGASFDPTSQYYYVYFSNGRISRYSVSGSGVSYQAGYYVTDGRRNYAFRQRTNGDIVINSSGQAYIIGEDDQGRAQVGTIDLTSGVVSNLRYLQRGGSYQTDMNGLAFDPIAGTYYVSDRDSLYTLNVSTGAMSLVTSRNSSYDLASCGTTPARPTLAKSFNPTSVELKPSGETTARLTLTVGNRNSNSIYLTSNLTDLLPSSPAQMAVASVPNVSGTCPNLGRFVTAAPGSRGVVVRSGERIPSGGCTISVDVKVPAAGTYTNNLTAGDLKTTAGSNPSSTSATLTVRPVAVQPQLALSKSSNGPWTVGQSGATYTLNVKNVGSAASSGTITLRDQLPAGVTLPVDYRAPAGWDVSVSGRQVTFTTSQTLDVSGSTSLTFPVVVGNSAQGTVTNRAAVGGGGDPDPMPDPATCTPGNGNIANQCAQVVTTVNPGSGSRTDLAVYKDIDLSNSRNPSISKFYVGDTVRYTLQVVNNGPADVNGAVLTDVAEPGLEGLTWTCTTVKGDAQCPAASGSGLPNFTIPRLGAGSELKIVYTANVTAVDPQLTNTAEIKTPAGVTDSNPANNKDTVYICTFDVNRPRETTLTLAKSSNGPWTVGQSGALYTLTIGNEANFDTQGTVTVRDLLPNGITPLSSSFAPAPNWACTVSGQLVICSTSQPVVATKTVTITIPVNVGSAAVGTVINRAAVGGGGDPDPIPDPATCTPGTSNPANQCAQTSTPVTAPVPLKMEARKTVQNITAGGPVTTVGNGNPGDVLEYCITTSSVGGGVATNLRFADSVPVNTTFQLGSYGAAGQDIRYTDPAGQVTFFTAAADNDPASLLEGQVRVSGVPPRLEPGQQYQICFRATIK